MKVLVVAATDAEIAALKAVVAQGFPVRRSFSEGGSPAHTKHHIDFLTTGVGMVATAVRVSRALAMEHYDAALNLGVCGSFDPAIAPGTVVHVVSDRLAELGAEDGDAFLTLAEMNLSGASDFINPGPPPSPTLSRLQAVAGITVNTVHGNERSIAGVAARFHPQVESMEGAAFMSACLEHGIRFAQVRAVSNRVERRNRASWKLAEAIAALTETARLILGEL